MEEEPTIPDMDMGVDKQAMVQDWLNPDNTTTAPLVQFHQDNLAIQKFSKVYITLFNTVSFRWVPVSYIYFTVLGARHFCQFVHRDERHHLNH